jgi:hypothetical protein
MDRIVEQAARAVTSLGPRGNETSGLQENQIRNAINVADESSSILVVTNFIRYQIGRSSRGKEWQYNGFGLRLVEDIEAGEVLQAAKAAAKFAAGKIGPSADEEALKDEAHLELTRYYLGYLNRAFIFCTKTKETGHLKHKDPWAVVTRLEEA